MSSWALAFHTLSYALTAVCLFGAALLCLRLLRSRENVRSRRTLAFILLMWGLASLPDCLFLSSTLWLPVEPMGIILLIGGNLYVIVCLLYPLELAGPGWIGVRNVSLLVLPFVLLTGIYFAVLAVLGQPVRSLHSAADMLVHFGEFNVWYRLVLYLSVCFYLAYLFLNTSVTALEMRHMADDTFPRIDRRSIAWLRFYGIGMICICFVYMGVLMYGNMESLTIHRLVTTLFFGIIVYNALFNRPLTVLAPSAKP